MATLDAGRLVSVAWTLVIVVGLFLPPHFAALPVAFDCMTLLPSGRYLSESQSLISPCPIAIRVGQNYVDGTMYKPGQPIRVQFSVTSSASVPALLCRASQVLVATALGVWKANSDLLATFACLKDGDAVVASGISGRSDFDAFWTPPDTSGLGDMEIVCSVVSEGGKFWIWNSFMISESISTNDV